MCAAASAGCCDSNYSCRVAISCLRCSFVHVSAAAVSMLHNAFWWFICWLAIAALLDILSYPDIRGPDISNS